MRNQNCKVYLPIQDSDGDIYYCCILCHSLTGESQSAFSFTSYQEEENLNLLFWDNKKLLVLDNGKQIYLIDDSLTIRASFEITTPLIGLYLVGDKLLILEEAFLRVVDSQGNVLECEVFDLIENFDLVGNTLFIQTNEGKRKFDLL